MSHVFSETALRVALRNVGFSILIRGHELVWNGISWEFKGRCYTVHTTTRSILIPTRASLISLKKLRGTRRLHIDTVNNPLDATALNILNKAWCIQLWFYFWSQFKQDQATELDQHADEKLLEAYCLPPKLEGRRFINYTDLCL